MVHSCPFAGKSNAVNNAVLNTHGLIFTTVNHREFLHINQDSLSAKRIITIQIR